MAEVRYLEDFAVGQVYHSADYHVSEAELIAFARQYDPQILHIDPDGARRTEFGGLIASGFHTAAVTMRLLVTSDMAMVPGAVGIGLDRLRWRAPVRPGDTLSASFTVDSVQPSVRRAGWGTVTVHAKVANQSAATVLEALMSSSVPSRAVASG